MKNLLLLVFILTSCTFCQAQSLAYTFKQSNDTLEQLDAPTLLLSSMTDDGSAAPISFPFNLNGAQHQQVYVNANGFVTLDVAPAEGALDNYITEAGTYPMIAAWADDLFTASNGSVCYQVTGNPQNRKLVIEWKVKKYSDRTSEYNKTFQLWLLENGNIQFVYGKGYTDDFNGGTIGIAASQTDFLTVDVAADTVTNKDAIVNWGAWPANTSYLFECVKTVAPLTVKFIEAKQVSCFGKQDGAIQISGIEGGSGNYRIVWTGSEGYSATGSSLTGLKKGEYRYAINDGEQSIQGLVTIKEPKQIALAAETSNTDVISGYAGITVTTNASYTITNNLGEAVTGNTKFAPGTYTVNAYAVGGNEGQTCTATPVTVVVEAIKKGNIFRGSTEISKSTIQGFKVFPNPSTGNFKVRVRNNNILPAKITIYSVTGRPVSQTEVPYDKVMQDVDFNLSNLPNGTYVVEYICGIEKYSAKLIIQRS